MPKPMPVLMEDSRFFTTAEMASRLSGLIFPVVTRFSISSSMASHRLVARISGRIFYLLKMSPKSIASESFRRCISPQLGEHFKLNLLIIIVRGASLWRASKHCPPARTFLSAATRSDRMALEDSQAVTAHVSLRLFQALGDGLVAGPQSQ